jgi:hypothetical protein
MLLHKTNKMEIITIESFNNLGWVLQYTKNNSHVFKYKPTDSNNNCGFIELVYNFLNCDVSIIEYDCFNEYHILFVGVIDNKEAFENLTKQLIIN